LLTSLQFGQKASAEPQMIGVCYTGQHTPDMMAQIVSETSTKNS